VRYTLVLFGEKGKREVALRGFPPLSKLRKKGKRGKAVPHGSENCYIIVCGVD
jgi:hypothetical protein